jgi:hypothetical protein
MTAPLSVCIFGNSHLAAVKSAWNVHESKYPQINIKFFGAPGAVGVRLPGMEFTEGKAVATDPELVRMVREISGGDDSVALNSHDALVVIGLGLGFRPILLLLRSHLATEEYKTARQEQELISEACLIQCIKDLLNDNASVMLLKKLKANTNKPIYVCTEPYLSEAALDQVKFQHLQLLKQNGALERIRELYSRCLSDILADVGASLIEQPKVTIDPPCFTKRKFSRGSTFLLRERKKHPEVDIRHMNKKYGALLLKSITKRITRAD